MPIPQVSHETCVEVIGRLATRAGEGGLRRVGDDNPPFTAKPVL